MSNNDLSRFNTGMILVIEDLRETVVEYGARLSKTDAVLLLVRPFLSRIPFETYRQSLGYQFPSVSILEAGSVLKVEMMA